MAHYLLVYDRSAGKLLRKTEFGNRADAMRSRFKTETEFGGSRNIEIVTFEADSEEALRKTHGRYFLTLSELVARIA